MERASKQLQRQSHNPKIPKNMGMDTRIKTKLHEKSFLSSTLYNTSLQLIKSIAMFIYTLSYFIYSDLLSYVLAKLN